MRVQERGEDAARREVALLERRQIADRGGRVVPRGGDGPHRGFVGVLLVHGSVSHTRNLADERRTMVFFEAPHRLAETLAAMGEAFGPTRRAAVCRELTKTYEEVRRGTLQELTAWALGGVRGEITVVVNGAERKVTTIESELSGIRQRVAEGERLKDVCADVAVRTGLSKKALYDAAVAAGKGEGPLKV